MYVLYERCELNKPNKCNRNLEKKNMANANTILIVMEGNIFSDRPDKTVNILFINWRKKKRINLQYHLL